MAAPFSPRFALSAALFAALRGCLAGSVGFRECLADRPDGDIMEIETFRADQFRDGPQVHPLKLWLKN